METKIRIPFYVRLAYILLSLSLILAIVYVGQGVFVPIILSLLFAILLRPVVKFFNQKFKLPHVIAVIIAVTLFILLIVGVVSFVSWQIGDIADDWGKIKKNLSIHYNSLQNWVRQYFHVSYKEQDKYIKQATKDSINGGTEMVGNTLTTFTDALMNLVLVPFYTFLILLYRTLLINFLSKLVRPEHKAKLQDILIEIKSAIQSFLVGLLIEMGIVSALTWVGLMIVGVEYAVLLGVITGILNLIPYIGILVAGLLTIVVTLINSTDFSMIAGVLIVSASVQLIDNNVLVPMVVSHKVRINALVSIIGIVIGGAIAGVAGMFLAIPVIAILKVIFDRVENLEPWGFLMGDDLPKTYDWGKLKLPSLDAGNSTTVIKDETETKTPETNSATADTGIANISGDKK